MIFNIETILIVETLEKASGKIKQYNLNSTQQSPMNLSVTKAEFITELVSVSDLKTHQTDGQREIKTVSSTI